MTDFGRNPLVQNFFLYLLLGLLLAFGVVSQLHLLDAVSFFRTGLSSTPLFWWPQTKIVILAILFVVLLILYALYQKGTWNEKKWRRQAFTFLAVMATVIATALNTVTGVAVYADRILITDLSISGFETRVYPLSQANVVHLSCTKESARGSTALNNNYEIEFLDGRILNLVDGLNRKGDNSAWTSMLVATDRAILAGGADRIFRDPATHPGNHRECVSQFFANIPPDEKAQLVSAFSSTRDSPNPWRRSQLAQQKN